MSEWMNAEKVIKKSQRKKNRSEIELPGWLIYKN